MPQFWAFNPAYAQIQNEHVWMQGWMDIIQGGMTPQAAAEKAFKRVEEPLRSIPSPRPKRNRPLRVIIRRANAGSQSPRFAGADLSAARHHSMGEDIPLPFDLPAVALK